MKKDTVRNALNQLLPIMVMFLAIQLIFLSCQKPDDPRDSATILLKMRDLNSKGLDLSLVQEQQILERKVQAELKANKLSQDDAEKRRFEGGILTADMQLKAGVYYNQTQRMTLASQGLEKFWKEFRNKPIWDSYTVSVPHHSDQWTGATLYKHTVDTLSEANKKDLIYGFLPGYQIVDTLVHLTGAAPGFSYWFACFLLAFCVRAVVFPLTQRQLMWGRQMSQLQPLAKEIREKYKDDMQAQQAKTMQLYQEYGLNPYAGCLPAMIQLPLFLTVYQFMLHYKFEFQKGTFLWIQPNASSFFAPNLGLQDQVLIVIYGITMVISTLLTPVSDPSQATQQRMMGVGISLFFAGSMFMGAFPVASAFVLYWTFTNLLATAQSLRAYRLPMPAIQKKLTPERAGPSRISRPSWTS